MLSVNTNVGAMAALQFLNQTQTDLQTTQSHINSGLKVANAKDNGAIFAIAQNMRGNVAGYAAVSDSLNRGVLDRGCGHLRRSVHLGPVERAQGQGLAASDGSLDTASRNALNADFTLLRDQITTIVQNASFNGTNLVDGSVANFQALASADGTKKITANGQTLYAVRLDRDLTPTGPSRPRQGVDMISTVNASIQNVNARWRSSPRA
jgi:flagellin